MPARRGDPKAGQAALATWCADPGSAAPKVVATAVRFTLNELAGRHPGRALEVRVPPYGAVQCLPGAAHRRGTPPNVVETDPVTWLHLVTGRAQWAEADLTASGTAADLSTFLPLPDLTG